MLNKEMHLVANLERLEMVATRDGYGEGLVEAGKKNKDVVVLCADLTESTRSNFFAEEYPERFFEMGVAEQNMMGVAAGMALSGKVPFVSSYAVFSPGRNWDQLRVSVCYTNANVKIAGAHAGISAGPDGASHQALEDIAITRVLPNLKVIVPCDARQTERAVVAAAEVFGPVYLRFGKNKTALFTNSLTPFKIGKAQIFRKGKDLTIVGCGPIIYEALMVAEELKNQIDIEVINMHTVKPLDKEVLIESVKKTGLIVTAEEHQISAGLGGAVAETLSENVEDGYKMMRVGMADCFGESGESLELLSKYKMDREAIRAAVLKLGIA